MKRIALFLATNLAVLLVLGVVTRLLGINPGSLGGLLLFAAVFGFAGSLISLAMSKRTAMRAARVELIESPRNATEAWLLETVRRQADQAGIKMPDVGMFPDATPNAFATGMRRDDALVAVSAGLLNNMNREEVEAVLGHEVAHVANGDMVTMALIQGVLNTFVFFLARVIAQALSRGNERGGGLSYYLVVGVLEMLFGVLATLIAAWFSRQREFRADAGGAQYASRAGMIGALQALQRVHQPRGLPNQLAAFGILGSGGFKALFSTHPPLSVRIERLRREA